MTLNLAISAVVLAGGQGKRMRGLDKGLVEYQGMTMIDRVLTCLASADEVIINANRSLSDYAQRRAKVVQDIQHPEIEASAGPLLGILTGLEKATHDWVLFTPCDTPLLPDNYVEKMVDVAQKNLAFSVVAHDGSRKQPLHILLNRSLRESLLIYLLSGQRKTHDWLNGVSAVEADFSSQKRGFLNVNSPQDLEHL